MPQIRLLIVDDHPVLRQGMSTLLRKSGRIENIGEAATGQEALQLLQILDPDIMVLDAKLPDMPGMDVARQVRCRQPDLPILILSAYDDIAYVRGFIEIGVEGYLLKEEAAPMIINAVEAIAHGARDLYSPQIQLMLTNLQDDSVGEAGLTLRECEVLRQAARGKTNHAIGATLGISEKTVDKHLESIYRKLGAHSRTEAAILAIRQNLI